MHLRYIGAVIVTKKFLPFVLYLIVVGGCSQVSAPRQSGGPDGDASGMIAAHQAEKAALQACLLQLNQAWRAGSSALEVLRLRQDCIKQHSRLTVASVREKEIAVDPSVYGQFVRAIVAARNAETSGDKQEALRIYEAIDAEAELFEAEATRLSPPGINVGMDKDPKKNLDILNGNVMRQQLAMAQAKIGVTYECAGRYPEAADYYQKALNTNGTPKGDGMMIGERLGFLYANGLGVPKDEAKASDLFSVRASQRAVSDLLHPPSAADRRLCPG